MRVVIFARFSGIISLTEKARLFFLRVCFSDRLFISPLLNSFDPFFTLTEKRRYFQMIPPFFHTKKEVMALSEIYIKPAGAFRKLKKAFELKQPVYIYGATGFGKTEMIKKFLEGRNYFYLSCMTQRWDVSELLEKKDSKRVSIAVIDDIQLLSNKVCREEVAALLKKENIQVVLIGRIMLPEWLISSFFANSFCVLNESDLGLSEYEIKQFFLASDVIVTDKEIANVRNATMGHPFALRCLFPHIGKMKFELALEEAMNVFGQHLTENVYTYYDSDVLDFLCRVSIVDEFTPELARMITGIEDIDRMIKRCEENAAFFTHFDDIVRIRPEALEGFRRYREKHYSRQAILELYYNAAMYYQLNGKDIQAIKMFSYIDNSEHVINILIRNSRNEPGVGNYYEMREYYAALSDKEIESSIYLMRGMSMLCSLLMDTEKSEYWYNRLAGKIDDYRGVQKKEAEITLAYLDISLPHRRSNNMIAIVQRSFDVMIRSGMSLPSLGLTSNLPSLINGGKDFCRWSEHDDEIVGKYGKMVCAILGIDERHIAKLALGESYYEKGFPVDVVLNCLSGVNIDARSGDDASLEFVAAALRTRILLSEESAESAEKCFDGFLKKFEGLHEEKILTNAYAMRCRLSMTCPDMSCIENWYGTAPDENNDFYIMNRFLYMVKIRCYIIYKKYVSAAALISKLRYYAESYGRTYLLIQLGLLSAILKYRTGGEWQEELTKALRKACEIDYVSVVAEEGAAVFELLSEMRDGFLNDAGIRKEWFERIFAKTKAIALKYPSYLRSSVAESAVLTENAVNILKLQAEGLTVRQISERLSLKEATVKYHIKETYKKFGVNTKIDAVRFAERSGII